MALFSWGQKEEEEESTLGDSYVPKYGTYCRTVAIQREDLPPQYLEAYQNKGDPEKWTVNKITVRESDGTLKSKNAFRNISFEGALFQLAVFENSITEENEKKVGPTAEELEDIHYVVFARREGIYFDTLGAPQIAEHDHAIPNGTFTQDSIAATQQAVTEARSKPSLPEKGGLTSLFAGLSYRGNFDVALDAVEDLSQFDKVIHEIEKAQRALTEMIHPPRYGYRGTEKIKSYGKLKKAYKLFRVYPEEFQEWSFDNELWRYCNKFDMAIIHLERAHEAIEKSTSAASQQMKKAILQIGITACALHAKQLFDNNLRGNGDLNNAGRIRELQAETERLSKQLPAVDKKLVEGIKAYIVGAQEPEVPGFISDFCSKYQSWRRDMMETRDDTTPLQPPTLSLT